MCKIYNKHKDLNIPKGAVYIGRPSKWGNPFVLGKDGTRQEVIEKFRQYAEERPHFKMLVKKYLKNKDLVCFCAPLACHGEVLREIANS